MSELNLSGATDPTTLCFTDGSNFQDKVVSWAFIAVRNDNKSLPPTPDSCTILHQNSGILIGDICKLRNIAGELQAVIEGVGWCKENGHKCLILHDLEGISLWGKGIWKRNSETTRSYYRFCQENRDTILGYTWTKSHANDEFNNMVDDLAGKTLWDYVDLNGLR